MKSVIILCFAVFFTATNYAQTKKGVVAKRKPKQLVTAGKSPKVIKPLADTSKRVRIFTAFGEMVVRLSDKTPKHRDNFIKLVTDHFYDSLLFHRVISGFMIQGGDPNSKNAQPGEMLGMGDIGYTIPAEFDSTLFHKKGALCAARTNNPEKASSGCQFYIVQGKSYSEAELENMSRATGVYYSGAKRMTYKVNGGTPFLDMNYTVFGEVISGFEVIDKIAAVQKGNGDRPINDVRMHMELIKDKNPIQ